MRPRLGNQVHPLPTPDQPYVYDRLVTVQPLLHPRFVSGIYYFRYTALSTLFSLHHPRCAIHIVCYFQCATLSLRYSLVDNTSQQAMPMGIRLTDSQRCALDHESLDRIGVFNIEVMQTQEHES